MNNKFFKKIIPFFRNEREVMLLIGGTRLILICLVLLIPLLLPFNKEVHNSNFVYPANEKKSILTSFKTWDGQHYIFLAEQGYDKSNESSRFFPLYPLVISLLRFFSIPSVIGGILISTTATSVAFFILYKLVLLQFNDKRLAFSTLLIGISFPTSFYFSLVYAEGLFFLLLVSLFYFLTKKNRIGLFFSAIFLPLTRPLGFLVILPMLLAFSKDRKKVISFVVPTFNKPIPVSFNLSYLYVLVPAFGLVCYFLFMKLSTGSFSAGLNGLNAFPNWDVFNILNPFGMIKNFFTVGGSLHSFHESYLDRAFFILFLLFLPVIYKKMDKEYFVMSIIFGLVPLFGSFISYTRYLLPIFPLWIAIAFVLYKKPALQFAILYISISIQIIFLTMHILNYWVA